MERKSTPSDEEYRRNVEQASRIGERVEHELRLAVPRCWVSTSVREFATVIDVRAGHADEDHGEQLCIQGLPISTLRDRNEIGRLARVVRLWAQSEP